MMNLNLKLLFSQLMVLVSIIHDPIILDRLIIFHIVVYID